jgi:hypothetical protein
MESGAATDDQRVDVGDSLATDRIVENEPVSVPFSSWWLSKSATRCPASCPSHLPSTRPGSGTTDVLCDRVAEELDLARVAVDADVREMGRYGWCAPSLRRAPVPLDRLVAPAEAKRLARDLLHGDRRPARRWPTTPSTTSGVGGDLGSSDAAASSPRAAPAA